MDFNLKQWRDESEEEEDQETTPSSKLPKLHFSSHQHHSPQYYNSALPLFAPQNSTTPRIMGSYYFSMAQWQELELQALIFRHMISGVDVPPQLLHLVKKSLITSPYYISNPIHHYYQPPLVQSGYWSKAAMDPEPGRCRRTDGKKWRCSRDVVAGHKYCDRHVHRGRNRSRKPVEIPTSAAVAYGGDSGGSGGALKTNQSITQFSLSGPSMDLLHLNTRPLNSIVETNGTFEAPNDGQTGGGGQTLRHFFDDWPRSLHETDNASSSVAAAAATNLSISISGNSSSDFSLKLGTGDGDERGAQVSSGRTPPNWSMAWETNRVAPMGGPLAEALRSSMSTSSPTSVLHRGAASEASYVVSS